MEPQVDSYISLLKNRKILLTGVSILIIGLIFYFYFEADYKERVTKAEYYVSIGDYDKAYDEIRNLDPKSGDKNLFDKIEMIVFSNFNFSAIKFIEETTTTSEFSSLEDALLDLVMGLKELDMKRANELGIQEEMLNIKNQYLDYLDNWFNLSEEEALKLNISDKDYEYKDGKRIYSQSFLEQTESAISYAKNMLERRQKAELEQARNEANPIEILDKKGEISRGYVYVSGAVKNVSKTTHYYIKVKVTHFDDFGNVIDTDWTYAVGSEGLRPNEQKYFEIMTKHRDGMEKFRVEIMDFD